jgi:RNA polymerase sigma-70 factor, ECF subfamily
VGFVCPKAQNVLHYHNMNKTTDYGLLSEYLKGNQGAFEVLVKRYMTQIYRFVYGYVNDTAVAEDITQEVFVKVWKHAKKIDQQRNFKSWLYMVAKNTTLDFFKKKKAVPFSLFENEEGRNVLVETVADTALSPGELSVLLEHKDIFLAAIASLSEKYRQILMMYYYEYLNFREIAEKLQEPINTVKSRHRRGLALLKQQIEL